MNLVTEVEQFLITYQLTKRKLVLGLSGGIDSVVLLNILYRSSIPNNQIIAVHVNHGLSDKSDNWQQFCLLLCKEYNISYFSEVVTLTKMHLGIEGAARDARYTALSKYVDEHSALLTAQHQDDQTETLLLALKRGSGILGLAGMPPIIAFSNSTHVRPLLNISQKKINDYAQSYNLEWVEDDSNGDTRFDRNFLRNDIINQLNERWPSFSANAARTAMLCQQQMQLSDEIAVLDFQNNNNIDSVLSVSLLIKLSDARVNNLIRYWLRLNEVTLPSFKLLEEIKQQCINARSDKSPIIKLGKLQIRHYANNLHIVNPSVVIDPISLVCDIHKPMVLPSGLGTLIFNVKTPSVIVSVSSVIVKAPEKSQIVTIEFGLSGSIKACPQRRDKRRALKKLWQEYSIPPWERSNIPYLCFDGVLVAAIGYWIEKDFAVTLDNNDAILTIEYQ